MSVVYSLYDALVSIKVADDKAKAVIDALEREMTGKLATRDELAHVREVLSRDMKHLEEVLSRDIKHQTSTMTLRLILAAASLVPAIVAVQKLF